MGNKLPGIIPKEMKNLDLSPSKVVFYSFFSVGIATVCCKSIQTILYFKNKTRKKRYQINKNKTSWAFVLNSTSKVGRAIAFHLARLGYNLILASFEANKLDEIKAELFLEFTNISVKPYYLYKTDLKNFEEKFHFKNFLNDYEVDIFILNDSLAYPQSDDFLEVNYADFQFEMSKKYLLKAFLFKILLENRKTQNDLEKSEFLYIYNINEMHNNQQIEVLNDFKYEEFWHHLIEEKYAKKYKLEIFNINIKIDGDNSQDKKIIEAIF